MSCGLAVPMIQWAGFGTGNTTANVSSMTATTTGVDNSAVGLNACKAITSGSQNTGVGVDALLRVQNGGRNVAVGYKSSEHLVTGSGNVTIGAYGGQNMTGWNNTYIGVNTGYLITRSRSNQIIIGSNTLLVDLPDNAILLGNDQTSSLFCSLPSLGVAYLPDSTTNREYKLLPVGGIYQSLGYVYQKLPKTVQTIPGQTVNNVRQGNTYGVTQLLGLQPIGYFYANNPNVTITAAGFIKSQVSNGGGSRDSVAVAMAVFKGLQGTFGVTEQKENAYAVDVGTQTVFGPILLLELGNFAAGRNQVSAMNLQFNKNLELGPYTICMVYRFDYNRKEWTDDNVQSIIPEITVVCDAPFL